MTKEVLEYCVRGVIRYLDGDIELFQKYIHKAMMHYKNKTCLCGKELINCKYKKKKAMICTNCGLVWVNREPVLRCNVRKIA